ncbi:flippase [Bifidobacterium pullorum subsp. saeculare]|uniref:flippase n=1 Tax=Bifidobacterium pullorum TaxID=78448 RepID=UPI001958CFF1|nr:flippase [Bifidobacterium pullorum]MBM6706788.1 flippase [Bifidobacterium pullorum subsp. saeculare]
MSLKKNALLNSIKQTCTIIFPLITFPYISRVLQSENYGKYSFASSIISYFSLIAALGVSNYAIREGAGIRNDKKRIEKFSSEVFTINILSTTISYILLFFTIIFWKYIQKYTELLLILSIGIIFTTIGVEWIYSIYEDYLFITIRSIVVQFVSLVLMFIFVKSRDDYIIYAVITVLASSGANIINLIYARRYVHLHLTMKMNLKQHLKPMLVLFCNAVMVTIYVNSDITVLGIICGDSEVGIYSVAAKIYTIVKNLLNAIIVVAIPRLSLYLGTNKLNRYYQTETKILKSLSIILFPALTGLFMTSNQIVVLISGPSYELANIPLRILCFALGFSVLASFITMTILLPNRQEEKILKATIISSITNLILNFIIVPFLGMNGAAFTTVLAEGIVFILSSYYSINIFRKMQTNFFKTFLMIFIGCIGIVLICLIINQILSNVFVSLIVKIVISGLYYLLILIVFREEDVTELIHKVIKL